MARPEPPAQRRSKGAGKPPPMPGLSGIQKAVAHAVVASGGFGIGWCFKGIALLAEEVAFSVRAVEAALAAMVVKGWLACEVRVLPTAAVFVRHYRITPVSSDLATTEERTAIAAAARVASSDRLKAFRARRATGDVRPHVTQGPQNVPQGPRDGAPTETHGARTVPTGVPTRTARGAYSTAGGAAEYLGDPEGVAPSCDAVSAAPEPPTHNVIAGMRVPARLRVAHAGYEAAALVMLADRLPALADAGCAYPVSLLGAEYRLGLLEIADAIASTANSLGCEATPEALAASLIGYGVLRPGRRAAVKRWLRKLGLPWSEGAAPMTALPIAAE